ncbi:hypothetical protein AB0F68_31440 [Micromonospora sp. NPDC023966]|uniref:hypothetical protein n=1 Tax=Micromonospora sp. NPDC023966 TaxID=3154699 RepID=UPI0033C8123F
MAEGVLWIAPGRFRYDRHQVDFCRLPYSEAVAVILEAVARVYPGYAISRVIPPGDAGRFHVLLAAKRSGTYTISIAFHTDADQPTVSTAIPVYIRRLRNERLPPDGIDGTSFAIDNGRLVLGSKGGYEYWPLQESP